MLHAIEIRFQTALLILQARFYRKFTRENEVCSTKQRKMSEVLTAYKNEKQQWADKLYSELPYRYSRRRASQQ